MTEQNSPLHSAVNDLEEEGDELYRLLKDMDTGLWTQTSTFKNWTVWDVVAHLHFADHMALTSLRSADDFRALINQMRRSSMNTYTLDWLKDNSSQTPTGPELLERWRSMFLALCAALRTADPDERFVWAGPGMKARMFATARQMETWAHGWEIYDLMGMSRHQTDRLKNIAEIGVRTFGWTFANRELEVPDEKPYVALTAPSGALWSWHDETSQHAVRGDAVEFCQVVTQVRNIADTELEVTGDNAAAWMRIAQCFAGPPEDPPAPGSRTQPNTN